MSRGYMCLADFIQADWIGGFAVTADPFARLECNRAARG